MPQPSTLSSLQPFIADITIPSHPLTVLPHVTNQHYGPAIWLIRSNERSVKKTKLSHLGDVLDLGRLVKRVKRTIPEQFFLMRIIILRRKKVLKRYKNL